MDCQSNPLLDTGDLVLHRAICECYHNLVERHFKQAVKDAREGSSEAMVYLESENALCLAVALGYEVESWEEGVERIRRVFVERIPKKKVRRRRKRTKSAVASDVVIVIG